MLKSEKRKYSYFYYSADEVAYEEKKQFSIFYQKICYTTYRNEKVGESEMNIGVIGAGAIGMLFSFYLQRAGAKVTLYTHSTEQAREIEEFGISCTVNGKEERQSVAARPLTAGLAEENYVLIAVKQYNLDSVMPHLQRTKARLIFLQNGMGHLPLLKNMNHAGIAVGIVEHGARRTGAAAVVHTGIGATKLGILAGEEEFDALLPFFSDSCFLIVVEEDWEQVLRNKLIVNACINPLTALYRVQNGVLLENPFLREAMKQVFAEVIFVLGEKEEQWERVCGVCRTTAENVSSMLTDVKLRRQTEIDAIVGYLLTQAHEQQKPAPLLSFLHQSVKGMSL